VIDLDITSPLRRLQDLENVLAKRNQTNADVVYSVTPSRRSPYFNMVSKQGEYYDRVISTEYSTRQQTPQTFDMNASIYAYSPEFLQSNAPFFNKGDISVMNDTGVLDIDNAWDFELMQVIASYLFEKDAEYGAVWRNIPKLLK